MRLWRRRKDAIELWLSTTTASRSKQEPRWTGEPAFEHAPDLDPSEVPPPERLGFDGRPLPKSKGSITGLEGGGGAGGPPLHGGG